MFEIPELREWERGRGVNEELMRSAIDEMRDARIELKDQRRAAEAATELFKEREREARAQREKNAMLAAENAREIASIKTQLAVISAMAKATEKAEGKTQSSLSTWLTVIGMIAGWIIAGVSAFYAVLAGSAPSK